MRLHIGCGDKFLPGYLHFDERAFSHVDYVGKAEDLSIFGDESVEEIYACHILEHFRRADVLKVLQEWFRVLCTGGVLRIAVPDFNAIAQTYLADHDLESVMGLLYGGQNYDGNFHYQTYDENRMKRLLMEAGFTTAERYEWRDFLPDGYDDFSRAYLPHMDFEKGKLMSLNILARK